MRAVGCPVVITEGCSVTLEQKHIGRGAPYNERWLQELVFKHPEAIPMNQIEPGLGNLIPICLELPLRCGFLDNLYATPDGDLVIVEVKLWRNHEMRRSVMAQALEYASAIFELTYEELDFAVRRAQGTDGRSLYQIAGGPEALDEPGFIDAVSHNLKTGRIVVLVVGDGIRSELNTLHEGLQLHAGFQFTFGLVELSVYEKGAGETLVVPRTMAATHRVERGVVRFEGAVDQVVLGAVQSIARTNDQAEYSMSSDAFYSAMSKLDATFPEKIRKLLQELEPLGVYPEFKKSLILRWGTPSGEVANLAYILRNGQVWTDQVSGSLGDMEVAATYLNELAEALGGQVSEIAGRPYIRQSGKVPQIGVLLECSAVFVEAVSRLASTR